MDNTNNRHIPHSVHVGYNFCDFCEKCNCCEFNCDHTTLYLGDGTTGVVATISCRSIEKCKALKERIDKGNVNEE